ncbi:hypothetical protein Clacol_008640 [Clathrus columnatus]|uniref:Uncharacterized protein n=1 Tax=Clathrus columnatus TaxID=1419009 RepID=A0AAV5APR8_9AGAM|nr:hypothetical protein Clacol_008640 [Clathrus columnatus]
MDFYARLQLYVHSPLLTWTCKYADNFKTQIWGVTIGGAILQNGLAYNLPTEVVSQVGAGVGLLYAIIPQIRGFDEPLRGVLQQAFLVSLRPVWIVITGLSVAGFFSSLIMGNVPMHIHTDKKWDPHANQSKETDVEKVAEGKTTVQVRERQPALP